MKTIFTPRTLQIYVTGDLVSNRFNVATEHVRTLNLAERQESKGRGGTLSAIDQRIDERKKRV